VTSSATILISGILAGWFIVTFWVGSGDYAFIIAEIGIAVIIIFYFWILFTIISMDRNLQCLEGQKPEIFHTIFVVFLTALYAISLPWLQFRINRVNLRSL